MTIKEIEERLQHLRDISGDDEMAHGEEDNLRDDFIISVSKRKDLLGKKAKLILTTEGIDFSRWCA